MQTTLPLRPLTFRSLLMISGNVADILSNRKKVNSKNKSEIVALKSTKMLFAKMLLLARTRNLDIEDVLKYSLRPYPHPLATNESDLVKTVKAKLLNVIEKE